MQQTKQRYPELTQSIEDMQEQSDLYRPTSFWAKASAIIAGEIESYGVDKFRSIPSILSYFVPTYGIPGNSLTPEMVEGLQSWLTSNFPDAKKPQLTLEGFLNGYQYALADYRVLLAADNQNKFPHLHAFSESECGMPVEQFEFDGKKFSRSSLNYLLGLVMLKKHLAADEIKTVMEIGGGFGTLGEILGKSEVEGMRYIDLDIPPTSFAASYYLRTIFGEEKVNTYSDTRSMDSIPIQELKMLNVLCAWQIEKLKGKVDLFVNFISFQEMEPAIVKNYLSHVKRLETKWILLRNMREGKQVKTDNSVGVEVPILSEDYMSMLDDYELVERNVFPYGYRTVDDYHSELLLFKLKNA